MMLTWIFFWLGFIIATLGVFLAATVFTLWAALTNRIRLGE